MAEEMRTGGLTGADILAVLREEARSTKKESKDAITFKFEEKGISELINKISGLSDKVKEYKSLISTNKLAHSKASMFTSQENAIVSLKQEWNKLVTEFKNKNIDFSSLGVEQQKEILKGSEQAKKVLRSANILEAITGDKSSIQNVSKEIFSVVSQMRSMPNFSEDFYNSSVKQYEKVFSILKDIQALGVSNGMPNILNDIMGITPKIKTELQDVQELLTLSLGTTGTQTDAFDKAANEANEGAAKTEEAYKQAKERIALSREELERELMSKPRQSNLFSDNDIFWEHDIDNKLSDIQKWSQAVEKIKESREYALNEATKYQNNWANGKSSKWFSNEDYGNSYKRYAEDYLKYSYQLTYAQEKLQAALKSYTPNAEGANAESLNALVLLLKNLNEQIEQVRMSFGTMDDSIEFQSLLSSINGINTALTSMKSIFVDVGDGEEFSPLFSMINNMILSIDKLKSAVDKIKLNINLDTSVNEEQALMKVEGRKQELLRAYQEQFSAMKNYRAGNSKMMSSMFRSKANSPEIQRLNKSILEFDESKYDNIEQKIKAYESIIQRMKEVSMLLYNENIYDNMDKNYQKEVTRSKGNLSRAQNALGKSSAEELEGLFGKSNVDADFSTLKVELGEIATKLGLVVDAIDNVHFDKIGRGFQEESSIVDSAIDSEKSALNTLGEKIDEITSSVDKKTDAFRQEEQIVIGTSQAEISALEVLDGQLLEIINTIQMLQSSPINLNIVGVEGDKNIITESVLNDLKQLKESLNGLTPDVFSNINTALTTLSIDESVATNIQRLSNAITNLKASLNNVSTSSFDFLGSIQELVNSGDALSNLVKVMEASKKEIQKAQEAAEQQSVANGANTSAVKTGDFTYDSNSAEWQEALHVLQKYSIELENISSLTRSVRQNKDGKLLESYKVTYANGSSQTIGLENGIVAQKDAIANADKIAKQYSSTLDKLITTESKAFRGDAVAIVDVEEVRKQVDELENELKRLHSLGIVTDETFNYLTVQRKNAAKSKIRDNEKSVIENAYKENEEFDRKKQEAADQQALIDATQQAMEWRERENARLEERNRLFAEGKAQEEAYYSAIQKERNDYISFWESSAKQIEENQKLQQKETATKSTNSYNEEIKLLEQINQLKIKNISANEADKAGNEKLIASLEAQLKQTKEKRSRDGLTTKDGDEKIIQRKIELTRELKDAQDAYNASSAKQAELNNQKLNAQSKYTQEDIDTVKALFQGAKLGNATFDSLGKFDGSGKGTIKFIEQVGNQTKETIVHVDDLNDALNRLSNGTFDSKGFKQTFETKDANKSSKKSESSSNIKEVGSVEEAYNKLISSEERYQKLKARIDTGKATDKENFNILTAQRDKYNEKIQETVTLTEKEIQLRNKYNQVSKDKKETVYDSIIDTANGKRVDEDAAWNEANRINEALKTTKNLMDQIRSSKLNIDGFNTIADDVQREIDKLNKKLINGEIGQAGYTSQVSKKLLGLDSIIDTASIDEAEFKMREYLHTLNGGKVKVSDFNAENNTMTAEFKDQKGAIQKVIIAYNKADGTIKKVSQGAKNSVSGLSKFTAGLKERATSLVQYLMTFVSFYEIWAVIKQGVGYVRELDTALTEMRKVSDESVQSLKNFQKASFDIASSVGTTAQQIQNSTADFMRLGESLNEASESAKVANILLNVSEFESIDEATESLVSMSAAFDELDKIEIVDKLNLVGNNFAISTDGLATALQKSASALKTAGNDMDEAIALVTAGDNKIA